MLGSAKTLNPVPSLLKSSSGLFYTCSTFYEIKLKGLYLHLTFYLAVVRDGSCHDLLLESALFRLRLLVMGDLILTTMMVGVLSGVGSG